MVDGAIKTIMIDDSATVAENLATICEKVGLPNPEEFSLQVNTFQSFQSSPLLILHSSLSFNRKM
jgi:hypothetical protein